jgi:hypothetical protein
MRLILSYFIVAILAGCNDSDRIIYRDIDSSQGHWIIRETYYKGRLSLEELLNSDSVRDGYYKKWEQEKLSVIGNYLNGKKEGRWFYLDAIGDTVKIENWFSGKKFGEQLDFFSRVKASGKPLLYRYSFFNLDEEKVFESRFNLSGQVEELKGLPLYTTFNKSEIQPDSVFELTCFVGVPQLLNYSFTIKEIDGKNKKTISLKEYGTNSSNQLVNTDFGKKCSVQKRYSNSGSYIWQLILKLADAKGKIVTDDFTNVGVTISK